MVGIVLTMVGIALTKVADTLTMVFDSEKMVDIFVTNFYKTKTMAGVPDTKGFALKPSVERLKPLSFCLRPRSMELC